MKELGERKKKEKERAEKRFVEMLREGVQSGKIDSKSPAPWNDTKRAFVKDERYDPVGSSSLREELYDAFVKTSLDIKEPDIDMEDAALKDAPEPAVQDVEEDKKKRREKAVKDREEKVKAERDKLDRTNAKSRADLGKEEGELQFRCAYLPLLSSRAHVSPIELYWWMRFEILW